MSDLIPLADKGRYCPAGDSYIGAWGRCERALITHAHADHARAEADRLIALGDIEPF